MAAFNSSFRTDLFTKLSAPAKSKSQLYSATQPTLLELLTHISEVSLLFEDKFTKEFLFELLNKAAIGLDELPWEEEPPEEAPFL